MLFKRGSILEQLGKSRGIIEIETRLAANKQITNLS
jgi:hypothetical protein